MAQTLAGQTSKSRLPLAEITPNSPSSVRITPSNQNLRRDSDGIVCGRVQELRDRYSRPGSPLIRRQNSSFEFDIHIDLTSPADISPTANHNNHNTNPEQALADRAIPIDQDASSPRASPLNLTPQAEQTPHTAEPTIKSHRPQLSPVVHATSSSATHHMAETPIRQQSRDTNCATTVTPSIDDMSPQQGQGELSQLHLKTEATSSVNSPSQLQASPASMLANTPSKRSVSNKENLQPKLASPATPLKINATKYDVLEQAVVEAATPPVSHSTPQSPFHAAVQHDLPEVDKLVITERPAPLETITKHEVESVAEGSSSPAGQATVPVQAAEQMPIARKPASPPRSKKDPGPRPTKASMARISLAHGGDAAKAPAWGRPRQSSGINNRLSISGTPRISSTGSNTSEQGARKEVSIPHSKPRPMSMSFPTPAPLAKSIKTPTRPTFQLPGEVVAQKLKEAREAREIKVDEKKTFKARPVPASIKNGAAVRGTNTSRARELLGLGKESANQLHSRSSSVAVMRPADRKSSVSSSRATSSGSDKPSTLGVSGRLYDPRRASSSLANIGKPRDASPPSTKPKQPLSGREVYNRPLFASEAAEREKREKEEATKKARAEAAERSRQLSREWAAKKRQSVLKSSAPIST